MASVLVLIPARYHSSRFPGKPLAKIAGKSMIEHVYHSCFVERSHHDFHTCVVTDDQRIEDEVNRFGAHVVRVDDHVESGSERIYLAYERFYKDKNFDFLLNVQGDEPLIDSQVLESIIDFHANSEFDIATVVKEKNGSDEAFSNPNNVKAILCERSGQCLYFTRSQAPFVREKEELGHFRWHHHIGIYSYRPKALERFSNEQMSRLEKLERLEQLRAMELGMKIGAIVTHKNLIGVDHQEDILKVEEVLNAK